MIKSTTADSFNKLAKILVKAFIDDAKYGYTTRKHIDDLKSKIKYPTEIEFMKAAIRTDRAQIERALPMFGWNGKLSNIMKRSEHFNILANSVVAGLKENAWRCKNDFGIQYKNLFGIVKQNKQPEYKQMEFSM